MRDIQKYTEDYNAIGFESYQVKYRRKLVIENISKYPHKRILEIGCGMEPLFSFLDNDFDMYFVIEPSEVFYKNACLRAEHNNKVTCINDYFKYSKELESEKFDVIICSGLLHELEKPELMLEDIYKISSEKTMVHLNVPNAKSLHRILAVESGIMNDEYEFSERNVQFQQNYVYDKITFETLVVNSNFTIKDSGSYFIKPFSHEQMFQMIQSNIIDERVLNGLYRLEKIFPGFGSELYINCQKKSC